METFEIRSSLGNVIAEKITGNVITVNLEPHSDTESIGSITTILSFDVEEWKKYNGKNDLDESIDILDLGYYYTSVSGIIEYEEPAKDWREMMKQLK